MAFLIKRYLVEVEGCPAYPYDEASPGKARAASWRLYSEYRDCTFKEFLKISRVFKGEAPEGYGRPILVSGRPGYWVGHDGQYVRFTFPYSDVVLLSHPLDVCEVE